jgi:CheY-like chemotaxis protein
MSEARVLLVEDSKTSALIAKRAILNAVPHAQVAEAIDIGAAQQALQTNAFPVVILDNTLPLGSASGDVNAPDPGLALLRDIRAGKFGAENQQAKILFNSGTLTPELQEMAAKAGADASIEKGEPGAFAASVAGFTKEHLAAAKGASAALGG